MFERILVPTDGSRTAETAMAQALDLAAAHGSAIHVLHVVDAWRYDTSIESAVDPLRAEGERFVDRLARTAGDGETEVTTAVEVGRPAQGILAYADEHGIDLVVIGTRGKGGLPRRLLGSVTDYVVTHAEIPVHVVPARNDEDE